MTLSLFLVAVFLAEGVVGKMSIPGFGMSTSLHLAITSGLIFLLFIRSAVGRRRAGGRRATISYLRIQHTLFVLICVGFISSVIRLNNIQNLTFWLGWAANFVVIWWVLPRMLIDVPVERIINMVVLILAASALGGIVFPGMVQGRLGGIYANPTTQARMLVLLYVLMFSAFMARHNQTRMLRATGLLAMPLLIMTRTRASIFAATYTTVLMAAMELFSRNAGYIKNRAIRVIVMLLIASTVGLTYIATNETMDAVYRFLRIDASSEEIYESARAMNWRASMDDFPEYGFFGWGFLSKFGITDEAEMQGFSLPHYDWTNPNDPLNMMLTAAKQLGWLGFILFGLFIASLWNAALRHKNPYNRHIAMSVLFVGMVWGLADGNWLTTFGDPVDRISMFILAIVLHRSYVPPAKGKRR